MTQRVLPLHTARFDPGRLRALATAEWRQLALSRVAPVFQAGFLAALAISTFLVGRLYETDSATLDVMWTFLPWIAAILAPALALKAFADNAGDRSLEHALSLPVTTGSLVAAKWLAGTAVLLVTLLLTASIPATVAHLGDLDGGAAFAGYAGAALLLAFYYAVALLAAALVRDPIGGFVAGVVTLLLLQILQSDAAVSLLRGSRAQALIEMLPQLTPGRWFHEFTTGRVPLAGAVYFLLACALALAITSHLLERRRCGGRSARGAGRSRHLLTALAATAAAAGVFAASVRIDAGIDLTEEQEFTLHAETVAAARSVPDGTRLTLYWSRSNADVPVAIRQYASRVERLARRIAGSSGGRIIFAMIDPEPDSEAEDAARIAGIRTVPLSAGGSFMLGAAFEANGRRDAIPYFASERAAVLEYDIAATLAALGRTRTPKVGILSSLLLPRNATEPRPGIALIEEIRRQYDVAVIPHFSDTLPEGLDALVVIDASILKPEMLRAIDRHVMRGGGLVVMTDAWVRFNEGSNAVVPSPGEAIDDISDLLARYGLTLNSAQVVGDERLASTVGAGNERFRYPFWLRAGRDALSRTHPLTAGLNELGFAEPASFTITPTTARVTVLVQTSELSGALPRADFKDGNPQALAGRFKPDGRPRVIAAAIEGPLQSAFANATSKNQPDSESTKNARIIAVADVDWIFDALTVQAVAPDAPMRPLNDNITAVSNMIEAAAGTTSLAAIRSRGRLTRPFTRVAAMLAASHARHKDAETALTERIARVEGNIAKVLDVSGAQRVEDLPADVTAKIAELRRALLPFRAQLRDLRLTMRQEVETLGRRITLLNIVAGPLLVALLALMLNAMRRRRHARLIATCSKIAPYTSG